MTAELPTSGDKIVATQKDLDRFRSQLPETFPYAEEENKSINPFDYEYLRVLDQILRKGTLSAERTGTGVLKTFGHQLRFDLSSGQFPLLTTKKLHTHSIVHELIWFLRGESNVRYLQENNVRIWNEWADEEGNLGPVYGSQWRSWPTLDGGAIDQISEVVETIRGNPNSRRLIVSSWNVAEIPKMALPPCHLLFQFYVANGSLSCQMYQRSGDWFLGVPFNIASYAALTLMIAQISELRPGDFVHTIGDGHLYLNHLQQAALQLSRIPKSPPRMVLNPLIDSIFDFRYTDFQLTDYYPHPHIKAQVSV